MNTDEETHAVLVAGRGVQARRGYYWGNGGVNRPGPCCPGCAIAVVTGGSGAEAVADHPASLALAEQFAYSTDPGESLSYRVGFEGRRRGGFTLGDILARWDLAIASVAPEPAEALA